MEGMNWLRRWLRAGRRKSNRWTAPASGLYELRVVNGQISGTLIEPAEPAANV